MDFDCTQKLDFCEDETFADELDIKLEVAVLEVNTLKYPLYVGENRVGRDSKTCSICIDNKVLSKQHAILELGKSSDEDLIYDLGSCNKTRLGNLVLKPLVHYQLRNNSRIMFGNISATFCRIQISDRGSKGGDKESSTKLKSGNLNNIVNIDGVEYDIHDAPTQNDLNTSTTDGPESIIINQSSAKIQSETEVDSAEVLEKTNNIDRKESSICENNIYEQQTQVYFQDHIDHTVEKSLGEIAANKEDLNIGNIEKRGNNPKTIFCVQQGDTENSVPGDSCKSKNNFERSIDVKNYSELSGQLLSGNTSVNMLTKNISGENLGTTIINEDSGDRSLLEGDEDMFEISMNCPQPNSVDVISTAIGSDELANHSKHSLYNIPKSGSMTEALGVSGMKLIMKSDLSGDETDPEDLFIDSSKKLITGNEKVSSKNIEPDTLLKVKNVSFSDNVDNGNTDPSSNDETDPEDIFCASTQKVNEKLLQIRNTKKQVLNNSNLDESTDMDDVVCDGTQKSRNTPLLSCIVAASPDKDSSVCSKTSEQVVEDLDLYSAPTQICNSQMFKTPMKRIMDNVSEVAGCKIGESESESILQVSPKIMKDNLLLVAESENGDTTFETSDIFSAPTQKISVEEIHKNVEILKERQKLSEKNVKIVDNSVSADADTLDTSYIFITSSQKISNKKAKEVVRSIEKGNMIEEQNCGNVDTHLRAKSSDNLISHGEVSHLFEGEDDDNDIFSAPTQNVSKLRDENEDKTCNLKIDIKKNSQSSIINNNGTSTENKTITSLEKVEPEDSGNDMSDISLAPTQIINHHFPGSIKLGDDVSAVRCGEEIIGSSSGLEEKETCELHNLDHSVSSKNGIDTVNTEVNRSHKKDSSGIKQQEGNNTEVEENFQNVSVGCESSLELPSSSECLSVSNELRTAQKNANSTDKISRKENKEVFEKSRKYEVVVSNEEACSTEQIEIKAFRSKALKKCRNSTKPNKLETEENISVTVNDTETTIPHKEKPALEYKEFEGSGVMSPILCKKTLKKGVTLCDDSQRIIKPTPFLGKVSDLFQEIISGPHINLVSNVVEYTADKEKLEESSKSTLLLRNCTNEINVECKNDKLEKRKTRSGKQNLNVLGSIRKDIEQLINPKPNDEELTSEIDVECKNNKLLTDKLGKRKTRSDKQNVIVLESTRKDSEQLHNSKYNFQADEIGNSHNKELTSNATSVSVESRLAENAVVDSKNELYKNKGTENVFSSTRSRRSAAQYSRETKQCSETKLTKLSGVEELPTTSKNNKRKSKEVKVLGTATSEMQGDTICNSYIIGEENTISKKRNTRRTTEVQNSGKLGDSSHSKQTDLADVKDFPANPTSVSVESRLAENAVVDSKNELYKIKGTENVFSSTRSRRRSAAQYSRETKQCSETKLTKLSGVEELPTTSKNNKRKSNEVKVLGTATSEMQGDTICNSYIIGKENTISKKRKTRRTTEVQNSGKLGDSSHSKQTDLADVKDCPANPTSVSVESRLAENAVVDSKNELYKIKGTENVFSSTRSRRRSAAQYSRETKQCSETKLTKLSGVEELPTTSKNSKRKSNEVKVLGTATSEMQCDTICNSYIIGKENTISKKMNTRRTTEVQNSGKLTESSSSRQTDLADVKDFPAKVQMETGKKQCNQGIFLGIISDEIQKDTNSVQDGDVISNRRTSRNQTIKSKESHNTKVTTPGDVEQPLAVIHVPIDANSNINDISHTEEEKQIFNVGLLKKRQPRRSSTRSGNNSKNISNDANTPQDVINEELQIDVSREVTNKGKSSKKVESVATYEERKKSVFTKRKLEAADSAMNKEESNVQSPLKRHRKSTLTKRKVESTDSTVNGSTLNLILPSQRSPTRLKWHVMFSKYNDRQLESIIKSLGGNVTEDPKECTVLVTENVRRTYKFLCAIGQGKPIVKPEWLRESQKAKKFLDPWDYVLNDKEAEKKFQFSLKKSLMLARQNKFLANYTVISTPKVLPPPEEMKGIVELSGGKYVKRVTGDLPEKSFIISCEADKAKWNNLRKHRKPIVNVEVLLLGVLQQHLDLEAHIL